MAECSLRFGSRGSDEAFRVIFMSCEVLARDPRTRDIVGIMNMRGAEIA
jgi:hypothetical protein